MLLFLPNKGIHPKKLTIEFAKKTVGRNVKRNCKHISKLDSKLLFMGGFEDLSGKCWCQCPGI
jgi:hypothetical protein